MDAIINQLLRCFPGSFVNYNGEFIANRRANVYFVIKDCKTERDVQCKVLEWFSRHASKSAPFKTKESNVKFRIFMRNGINEFLGTNFSEAELLDVYIHLGNGINHQLTVAFIRSGYDLSVFKIGRRNLVILADLLLEKLNTLQYKARTLEQIRGGNDVLHRLMPKLINEMATYDASTVAHGHWEYGKWENGHWVKGKERCRCSICHRDFAFDTLNIWIGCPHCLAKMDGDFENE